MPDPIVVSEFGIGAAVAIALGLVKIIEGLVKKLQGQHSILTPEEHQAIMMHLKFDEDGAPMWYFPRSWQQTQVEMAALLGEIVVTQGKIAETLERLERQRAG